MKNRTSTIVAVCTITMLFSGIITGYTQPLAMANDRAFLTSNEQTAYIPELEKTPWGNLMTPGTRMKIIRDYTQRFSNATGATWHKTNDHYSVVAMQNGIKTRTFYNAKGKWLVDVKSYSEQQMSKDIRSQVKSVYYDFDITLVEEVTNIHGTSYLVHLYDNHSWKNVRVYDGELELVSEFAEPQP